MKELVLNPYKWPCKLSECPPGFFLFEEYLCFKTEYGTDEVYNEAGEVFWGGTTAPKDRGNLVVTPCNPEWIEL